MDTRPDLDTLMRRVSDLLLFANYLAAQERVILEDMARRMAAGLPLGEWWIRGRERQIRAILARWEREVGTAYGDVRRLLDDQLKPLAGAYRTQAGQDVGKTVSGAAPREPIVVANAPIDRWVERQKQNTLHSAEMALRTGANMRETGDQLSGRISDVVRKKVAELGHFTRGGVTRAAMDGYVAGLRDAGVGKYRWLTMKDERVCDDGVFWPQGLGIGEGVGCRGCEAKVFEFDDPRIPELPPAHPGCRCIIFPVWGDVAVDRAPLPPGQPGEPPMTVEDWRKVFREELARRTAELTVPGQQAFLGLSARQMSLSQLRGRL